MKSRNPYLPLGAAALVLMLGACGGGDGSDPAAPGSSVKTGDTTVGAGELRFGDATLPTQASVVTKTMPLQKPISGRAGVRGDVLLTMMDQIVCRDPEQSTSYNGTRIPDGQWTLPRMELDQRLKPFNYEKIGGPSIYTPYMFYANGECNPEYFRYRPVQAGTHELNVYSAPYFRKPAGATPDPGLRWLKIQAPVTVTKDMTTVSSVIKVREFRFDARDLESDLSSNRDFSFRHDSRISWGVVQYWQNGSDYLKMMVVPGDNEGDARLCWNADNSRIKRLHCMTWRAPQGWTRGKPLDFVGQYLIDDRSVYPGEQGFLYARTF